jgi:hypothetical protein
VFNRPDLLAGHAGVCLGWAEAIGGVQAPGFGAEAELATAAGAQPDLIEQWITVGRQRAEQSRHRPYTG